jgi:hypothetical protein
MQTMYEYLILDDCNSAAVNYNECIEIEINSYFVMESGRNKLRKLKSKLFEKIGRKAANLKLN